MKTIFLKKLYYNIFYYNIEKCKICGKPLTEDNIIIHSDNCQTKLFCNYCIQNALRKDITHYVIKWYDNKLSNLKGVELMNFLHNIELKDVLTDYYFNNTGK